jgi:hypothetical protein
MAKEGDRGTSGRLLLLGLLVVAAVGAIYVFGSGGEAEEPEDAIDATKQPTPENVQLDPRLPKSALAEASWRKPGAAAEEAEGTEPEDVFAALDAPKPKDLFGDDSEKARKYQKSLEEVASNLQGAGIYVGRTVDDGKKPPGKEKQK